METPDRSGLPQELLKQLRPRVSNEIVLEFLQSEIKPVSADEVLIGLFEKTGVVFYRANVQQAFTRLIESKEITRVSRGMYQAIR